MMTIFLVAGVLLIQPVLADSNLIDDQVGFDDNSIGKAFDQNGDPLDPREIVVNILKLFLTFLGVISVTLIIYAGYMWMTAMGNDEKVGTAKKIITRTIFGLVIILFSYALVSYISTCVMDVATDSQAVWLCN